MVFLAQSSPGCRSTRSLQIKQATVMLAPALMERKSLMDRQAELKIIRAAYAKQILAAAGVVNDPPLEAALGAIRREGFLGAGAWPIMGWFRDRRYVTTPD